MNRHQYYVYLMSNDAKILYTGVTSDLERRVYEHRQELMPGFTKRYHLKKLVYYETTSDVHAAIAREKQVKRWRRQRKIALIEAVNPGWEDLSQRWFDGGA